MAKQISKFMEKYIPTESIAQTTDDMIVIAESQRKNHEKRWYDNKFFDDGFHFRYVSRTTGKIHDGSKETGGLPVRAIPKASRQLRGIANLLLGPQYTPVVYPERVEKENFGGNEELYLAALSMAKSSAKRQGHWLIEEWEEQELWEKIIQMVLLTGLNSVSYVQVYPDAVKEKIVTEIYDAFDIVLYGHLNEIQDCPFIAKTIATPINEIQANETFDPEQVQKLNPDNKFASSEIKEAYMNTRFGRGNSDSKSPTIILKEIFIKEYLNKDNALKIAELSPEALKGKKQGDIVMRHVFTAGGVWLKDEYLDIDKYPFVDFRFEPGPIYQVPLIERFIPANKSLDIIMSRIEKHINTMTVGVYAKQKNETYKVTNVAGGQEVEYNTNPPIQMQMAPIQAHVFEFINRLESFIEEQGASTAALGQLPSGVKSGVAIESLKATEFANLKIASDMLKKSVRRISEAMLDIASEYFMQPQTVMIMEQGEPQYFDIIGERGVEARKKIDVDIPKDAVVIKGKSRVRIEVESGLGFTMAGKRETIQQVSDFMLNLAKEGIVNPESVKVVVRKFLETFQFGATQEFMDALDDVTSDQLTDQQIQQMKIAIAEVMQDLGVVGPDQDEKMVQTTKLGVAEAVQDLQGGGTSGQETR